MKIVILPFLKIIILKVSAYMQLVENLAFWEYQFKGDLIWVPCYRSVFPDGACTGKKEREIQRDQSICTLIISYHFISHSLL